MTAAAELAPGNVAGFWLKLSSSSDSLDVVSPPSSLPAAAVNLAAEKQVHGKMTSSVPSLGNLMNGWECHSLFHLFHIIYDLQ